MLITRPEPEAARSAESLRKRGFAVDIIPLMACRPMPVDARRLHAADGFILTSQRAVETLPEKGRERPVFAVGARTAEAAKARAWDNVMSADGDWRDLATLIVETAPQGARLCHIAGNRVRGELEPALRGAGFGYERLVAYRMVEFSEIPSALRDWLDDRQSGVVLFYSPASAALWGRLGLQATGHFALCISRACADALQKDAWAGIAVADTPDEEALWRCLETTG